MMRILILSFILIINQLFINQTCCLHASSFDQRLIDYFQIDNTLETDNLIRKRRFEGEIEIFNTLLESQQIKCLLKSKNKSAPTNEIFQVLNIPANNKIILKITENYVLNKIETLSTLFLIVKEDCDSRKITILIEDKPTISYPKLSKLFNFIPRFIHDPQDPLLQKYYDAKNPLIAPMMPLKNQEGYDNDIGFILKTVCPQEGINGQDFFEQRQKITEKFNLNKLFFQANIFDPPPRYRIPQIIHRIWLTSLQDEPIEMPLKYIEWAKESMLSNPSSQGWHHVVWIQQKDRLPLTVKRLQEAGLEVKEMNQLHISAQRKKNIEQAIQARQFGKASDILRYLILKEQGGIYVDTDYLISQSCNIFNKIYDFYVGLEPPSVILGNAFIAARPNHPIINRVLDLIDRNLKIDQMPYFYFLMNQFSKFFNIHIFEKEIPDYLQNIKDNKIKTVMQTGPVALTVAFYQAAGQQNNRDIIFEPMILFPTSTPTYPNINIVKPNEPIPQESLGVHFWDGSWHKKKLKNKG